MGLREDTLLILGDLIGFPTVTSETNLDLIDHAEAILTEVGAATSRTYDEHGLKANLFATIGPAVDGGVVLSGHTDVVPAETETWTGAPFVATRRGQKVFGRGAADMKGFIACALAMAPRFAEADLGVPVHIALTFDEEVGCKGAPLLLAELARTGPRPAVAIVGEPTSMRVVVAHKGCYEYTTTIRGLEGHGSAPDRGVNAVELAARYVGRLLELRREFAARADADSPFDPPGTTISVGTIAGGTARNVVAGECSLDWEVRPVRREDADHAVATMAAFEDELLAEMRAVDPEASIETVTVGAVDGLEPRTGTPAFALVRRLLGDTGVDVVSFGTEAGLYQQAGIPAVVCGPGSIDVAHRPDEHVAIDQLERCLEMMERLIDELSVSQMADRPTSRGTSRGAELG